MKLFSYLFINIALKNNYTFHHTRYGQWNRLILAGYELGTDLPQLIHVFLFSQKFCYRLSHGKTPQKSVTLFSELVPVHVIIKYKFVITEITKIRRKSCRLQWALTLSNKPPPFLQTARAHGHLLLSSNKIDNFHFLLNKLCCMSSAQDSPA